MCTEFTHESKRNIINDQVEHCVKLAQIQNIDDLDHQYWTDLQAAT